MKHNFAEVLTHRIASSPDRLAYSFAADSGAVDEISYGDLVRRSIAIGESIDAVAARGDRVLLLLPPGLDYIAAFIACLVFGFISIPAYPLRKNQRGERTRNIIADANPTAVLLPAQQDEFSRFAGELEQAPAPVLLSDIGRFAGSAPDTVLEQQLSRSDEHDVVFLQYTSGSTGSPKGVMVTHANLTHNSGEMQKKFRTSTASSMVSWLPPCHDMGLILGILQPLFAGFPCHVLPPASFMQSPMRWLRRITEVGATISGGPNFAYDLCVKRSAAEGLSGIDFSTWSTAFNGAEPVTARTLRNFAAVFSACGFSAQAIRPCYGLAENTLMATGQDPVAGDSATGLERYVCNHPSANELKSREIVDCGTSIDEQRVVVVDPDSHCVCDDGSEGEIWISGKASPRVTGTTAPKPRPPFGRSCETAAMSLISEPGTWASAGAVISTSPAGSKTSSLSGA